MLGVVHKLDVAGQEIRQHLTNVSQRLSLKKEFFPIPDINVLHAAPDSCIYASQSRSHDVADQQIEAALEGYRCKCSFQLVPASFFTKSRINSEKASLHKEDITILSLDDLVYSVREHGDIIPLRSGIFSPANRRIRRAMACVMECLNTKRPVSNHQNRWEDGIDRYHFQKLRKNLTSVTFVSSWGDGMRESMITKGKEEWSGDCHATLHFGPPGLLSTPSDTNEELNWKEEAQRICDQSNLTSLTGRSRGVKFVVFNSNSTEFGHRERGNDDCVVHDDLWITMRNREPVPEVFSVSLVPPVEKLSQVNVKVQYRKSSVAFQHPNAGVMLTSLQWILNTLSQLARDSVSCNSEELSALEKPRLLELYCGCGAHTIPIAKSSILSQIVAVELDERLVTACRNNCILNDCLYEEGKARSETDCYVTKVSVVKEDAAVWAKNTLMSNNKQNTATAQSHSIGEYFTSFDILLVDPPRDGLDKAVCDLALKGRFQHIIYVSCGRSALLRDLDILCIGGFDVAALAVIDLFPGTDAVESLVHLRRRL
ncbi:hypothetical protein HJC23_006691 [Cyclotella cryptica]|uniref:tRNA (Uracil-5-)-methyltransferase n=1 Tax=Cyclotella cryptica TaxID=29204 RepID=A0ABD3QXE6_9STRA|eukprot:CCRYP_001125-RA/>CCRYP_001125-RA protein AED:0.08 eAED:0.08 QI:0/-1/0/1/-1/1/1/0/540